MEDRRYTTDLYFESHCTISPQFDKDLERVKLICANHSFRVADLLMQKRKEDVAERSKYDTFATGRSEDYEDLKTRTLNLVRDLEYNGFQVYRFKIENTLLDSKYDDSMYPLAAHKDTANV